MSAPGNASSEECNHQLTTPNQHASTPSPLDAKTAWGSAGNLWFAMLTMPFEQVELPDPDVIVMILSPPAAV